VLLTMNVMSSDFDLLVWFMAYLLYVYCLDASNEHLVSGFTLVVLHAVSMARKMIVITFFMALFIGGWFSY
jgi:hypothetical protein